MKKIIIFCFLLITSLFSDDFTDAYTAYNNEDYEKAIELYKKACEAKNAQACSILGGLYSDGKKDYIRDRVFLEKSEYKALSYYEKACEYGEYHSCYEASNLYAVAAYIPTIKEDDEKVGIYAQKACNGNIAKACIDGAKHYSLNKIEKIKMYKKACELGLEEGCEKYEMLSQ